MKLRKFIIALSIIASTCLCRAQEADILDIATLVDQNRYDIALDSLRLMVQRDSLDDAVWYYIGLCHSQMGRGSEAASAFLKAQALDPGNQDYRSYYILDQIGPGETTNWRQSASANLSRRSRMTFLPFSAFRRLCACRAIWWDISQAYSLS